MCRDSRRALHLRALVATLTASFLWAPTASAAKAAKAAKPAAKPAARKASKDDNDRGSPRRRGRERKRVQVRLERSRWEETDVLPAVQNRRHKLQHELSAGVAHLPLDPYTKGVAATGRYAWHLNHALAIEGQFGWVFHYRASLREDLENNFGEPDTKFRRMNWYGKLGVLFKPLYGKLAFFNRRLAYGEFFLSGYAVLAQLEGGEKTENEPAGRGQRFAVGVAPGFGIRGFITESLSMRFDFNWMVLFTGGFLSKADSPFEVDAPLTLTLTLAYSLNFGSDDE